MISVLASAARELAAISPEELVSVVLNLAYSVLAIRRSRMCWLAGGLGSAILIHLAWQSRLPMQAALQLYYVVVSAYGWWCWSSEAQVEGRPHVSTWPWRHHLAACAAIAVVSALSARWLAVQTFAAWPFLDSLTTWASLFATWLTARVKLENWLYWLAIDSLLAYLFAVQGLHLYAALSIVYLGCSVVGFTRWLRTLRAPLPVH